MHINSVFSILNELGVGPEAGFQIEGADEKWEDFITDRRKYDKVKTYFYLKVQLYFDPTQNTSLTEAINKQIGELEWRLNVSAENAG